MKNMKSLVVLAALVLVAGPVFAQEAAAQPVTAMGSLVEVAKANVSWIALAAGLGLALAAFGGTMAQGRTASAALEGIARNPAASGKLLVPLVLSLALIESLIIFTLLIAFNLTGSLTALITPIIEMATK